MRYLHVWFVLIAFVFASPTSSPASWPPAGVPLSTAANNQDGQVIVPDGFGGAIIAWEDSRGGTGWDIYAQRLSAAGIPLWTTNGVAVCTEVGDQRLPRIASDGAGGAIIAWTDERLGQYIYDIYVQRVSASGSPLWTINGNDVSNDIDQRLSDMVSDGDGGAIITWGWKNIANGTDDDIYAQRIDASGFRQWTANGVAVCAAVSGQGGPKICSDTAGGAVFTWQDYRGGLADVYAQRCNASGSPLWAAGGVDLTSRTVSLYPMIASDGGGGAIVTWEDPYLYENHDVYAQHVTAAGTLQWPASGAAVCIASFNQLTPRIIADGAGGAIIAWTDTRGTICDIYAQRLNAAGTAQWIVNGVAVCAAATCQQMGTLVTDGAGGAIVTWEDQRGGVGDIYAQRVNATGTAQWTANGVALCDPPSATWSRHVPTIASDRAGGAFVTWYTYTPPFTNSDVYAQRVDSDGAIPTGVRDTPPASAIVTTTHPNPFSAETVIDFSLASDAAVRIDIFDVSGRKIRTMELGQVAAGSKQLRFDGLGDNGHPLASGVYFYRVEANGQVATRKLVITR